MARKEKTYRTEGVVLRRSDFGEADRLLTIMTPHRGKIRALAKGCAEGYLAKLEEKSEAPV